jgi:lipoprotein NlpI
MLSICQRALRPNWTAPAFAAALLFVVAAGPVQAQQQIATGGPSTIGGETLLRGDFAKALDSLTRELDTADISTEKRAALLNDRGVAQWRIGALKAALDDLNKAATIYPELASVYNNRGNVLLALQAPAEAVRDFERAVLLAPSYAAAYNNRAIAQM